MPEYRTGSGTIYYEIVGHSGAGADTPWLILIHNFMSSGRSAWDRILRLVADDYRILLPDLPGHGRSIGYPSRFDHLAMARQIAGLMHAVGAGNGHLGGVSGGGMVAQLLVQQRLVMPATLTLVSTTYSLESGVRAPGLRLGTEDFGPPERWFAATATLHDPYHYAGYFEDEMVPAFERLNGVTGIDLTLEMLSTWALPVCIIHGDRDTFFPTDVVERMAAAIPDAELHLIPDQDHSLIFRKPRLVGTAMAHFLSGHAV